MVVRKTKCTTQQFFHKEIRKRHLNLSNFNKNLKQITQQMLILLTFTTINICWLVDINNNTIFVLRIHSHTYAYCTAYFRFFMLTWHASSEYFWHDDWDCLCGWMCLDRTGIWRIGYCGWWLSGDFCAKTGERLWSIRDKCNGIYSRSWHAPYATCPASVILQQNNRDYNLVRQVARYWVARV